MSDKVDTEGNTIPVQKQWVQFEEHSQAAAAATGSQQSETENPKASYNGAVIDTETVQVDIGKVKQQAQQSKSEVTAPANVSSRNFSLKNISLDEPANGTLSHTIIMHNDPTIQRGFANGDVIVTVLPVNQKWPWITPAEFRPELVPEELMAEGLSLTVEDYVQIVETLVHDVRFTAYNVCYKRLLMAWLLASFIILLGLLFSGAKGLTLFGCGVIWLIINAGAIFLCMWLKSKMNHSLEQSVAKANRTLIRHRIILGVDDRGKLSCHKINLCFLYFDVTDCVRKLQQIIESEENAPPSGTNGDSEQRRQDIRSRMDIDDSDIVVAGANTTRISRKQDNGERLVLRYSQRWAKDYLRHRLDWSVDDSYSYNRANPSLGPALSANYPRPRHLSSALCLCQYIEDYLRNKPRKDPRSCCSIC